MTGRTYEERVNRAKGRDFIYRVKSLLRINKKRPERYANVCRHGYASINPSLTVVNKE